MPPALDLLPFAGDWWTPLAIEPGASPNGPRYLSVAARLADEATAPGASRELPAIAASIGAAGNTGVALEARALRLGDAFTARAVRVLYPMLGAMALVLAMGIERRHVRPRARPPPAARVRRARRPRRPARVDAPAGRGGGRRGSRPAVALLLAHWITDGLVAVLPADLPRLADARVDARAIAVLAALSGATALALAALGAWRHTGAVLVGEVLSAPRAASRMDTPAGVPRVSSCRWRSP
ncbi:MAG: hypothetical protein R2712_02620 [Vicinamibacterales bacterium]